MLSCKGQVSINEVDELTLIFTMNMYLATVQRVREFRKSLEPSSSQIISDSMCII